MPNKKLHRIIEESVKKSINRILSEERHEKLRKKLRRATNESEDVMRRFYGINTNHYKPIMVEHITIDRIMNKHGNDGYIIVSATRNDVDPEINDKNTQELINLLKSSGYSYLPTYGGYHNVKTGEDSDYEPSFVIFNHNSNDDYKYGNFEDLENFGKFITAKYEQDCFLCKRPDMPPVYLDKDGHKINARESEKYWKNDPSKEFFTTLHTPEDDEKYGIGRRWTNDIEFECVNPIPCSLTERMRRKGEIMLY